MQFLFYITGLCNFVSIFKFQWRLATEKNRYEKTYVFYIDFSSAAGAAGSYPQTGGFAVAPGAPAGYAQRPGYPGPEYSAAQQAASEYILHVQEKFNESIEEKLIVARHIQSLVYFFLL
jgi:hypothetical protein